MLTVNQVVDNLLETILPLCAVYLANSKVKSKVDTEQSTAQVYYEMKLYEYEVTACCLSLDCAVQLKRLSC